MMVPMGLALGNSLTECITFGQRIMATSEQNVWHEKFYAIAHSESKRNFQMPTYLLVLFLT